MKVINDIPSLQKIVQCYKRENKSVGFVPTMGNLHQGHLSLVKQAQKTNDISIVSIFVNPTQFNNAQDLEKYPRTIDHDTELLKNMGCDILFIPSEENVYQQKPILSFQFGFLEKVLEGKYRDDHFSGVAMIVSKLFHWVNPDEAFFGQKDLQQFRIIESLVKDLSFSIKLNMCPIVREPNGLAMSSRNNRLSPLEKEQAACIYESLTIFKKLIANTPLAEAKLKTLTFLKSKGIELEYLEVVDSKTLESKETITGSVICIAAYIGEVRLIDNLFLD